MTVCTACLAYLALQRLPKLYSANDFDVCLLRTCSSCSAKQAVRLGRQVEQQVPLACSALDDQHASSPLARDQGIAYCRSCANQVKGFPC